VKTLGPFVAKALARLHRAPALSVLIAFRTSPKGITVALFAIPTAEAEATLAIRVSKTAVVVEGFVASGRGECHSRRRKDNVLGIWVGALTMQYKIYPWGRTGAAA
jgi:hypothetical protein